MSTLTPDDLVPNLLDLIVRTNKLERRVAALSSGPPDIDLLDVAEIEAIETLRSMYEIPETARDDIRDVLRQFVSSVHAAVRANGGAA